MKQVLLLLAVASIVVSPKLASAQGEGEEEGGDPVELGEDPMGGASGDPEGTEENPGAPPVSPFQDKSVEAEAKTTGTGGTTGYPMEEVLRPLTLPQYMTEVSLDYPVFVDPFAAGGILRGHFGVTREFQLGLFYGIGTATEDGYEVGKALALDFSYLIQDWIAAQVTVPFNLDPFALGATVAAPIKFTFLDKLSLILGEELVTFKIAKFAPVVENAAAIQGQVALHETNTDTHDAELRVGLRVVYQMKPNMALEGRARQSAFFPDPDTTTRNPFLFDGALQYSVSSKVDLGLRLGFEDLAEFNTFRATLMGAFRI